MKGEELREYAEWTANNYLSPLLQASQGTLLKSLPEDVKGQVAQIIEGSDKMSVDFNWLIPRISSSNLDPDSKLPLLDYANLLHVSKILNGNAPNSATVCEKISGLKSQQIDKEMLFSLTSEILREEIDNTTSLKELSQFVKLLKLLEEPALGYVKDLILIQASCVTDLSNFDIVYIAEQVNTFSEFSDLHDYSLNDDIISVMLDRLGEDQILKALENQGESSDIGLIDSDENIAKALNLVRNLNLGDEANVKIAAFIEAFGVKEEVKPVYSDEEDNEEEKDVVPLNIQNEYEPNFGNVSKTIRDLLDNLPVKSFDDFEILEELHRVDSKQVVIKRAKLKSDNTQIAVKSNGVKDGTRSIAAQAEYMAIMSNHPNFLKIYGSFWDTDPILKIPRYNIAMQYIPETLARRIERWETLLDFPKSEREKEALIAAKQLILAMRDLNEKRISHCDIKPSNILITEENVYKIFDFDVSKRHEVSVLGMTVTSAETGYVGTPLFFSPEIWGRKNGMKIDAINYNKSDVYSSGLTILRMITNRDHDKWNWKDEYLEAKMQKIISEEVNDENLKNIIKRMLTVEPKTRPRFRELVVYLPKDIGQVTTTVIDK